jgi:hypothetical protein
MVRRLWSMIAERGAESGKIMPMQVAKNQPISAR